MKTLDEFFELFNKTLKSKKFKNCPFPLFRGHASKEHKLLPTLQRSVKKTGLNVWTLENNLYCDFRSLVGPRIHFNSSWELVFAMRHEGIPTRFLDWTENLGTALFFALESGSVDKPHIWILDPFKLNKQTKKVRFGLANPEEDLRDYQETYANKCNNSKIKIHKLPIAVYPNRTNERIFAQRGLFTIHGTDDKSMELTCKDYLEKVEISNKLIDPLKIMLKQFGINHYSVYPDFRGLSDHLKGKYQY